jgi:hypothetical protein
LRNLNPPRNRGAKYFRRALKNVLVVSAEANGAADGKRLNALLQLVYDRLVNDLTNFEKPVDWSGITKLLQLFGVVLDKDKYASLMTAQGMNPNSLSNLRPPWPSAPMLIGLPEDKKKPDVPS